MVWRVWRRIGDARERCDAPFYAVNERKAAPAARLVRANQTVIIRRGADIGFYNFLIPRAASAEGGSVASTRYRQKATRRLRFSRYGGRAVRDCAVR
ncbi:hypothetical protein KCP73_15855 [Salmonella enterica subsp. enterica]|nr:hypothetical protein KCP73_15855 [Salmonella enterica subsp. enterica]